MNCEVTLSIQYVHVWAFFFAPRHETQRCSMIRTVLHCMHNTCHSTSTRSDVRLINGLVKAIPISRWGSWPPTAYNVSVIIYQDKWGWEGYNVQNMTQMIFTSYSSIPQPSSICWTAGSTSVHIYNPMTLLHTNRELFVQQETQGWNSQLVTTNEANLRTDVYKPCSVTKYICTEC